VSKTKTDEVHVVSFPSDYAEGGISVTLIDYVPHEDSEFTVHETIEVTYNLPPREKLVAKTVESLKALKEKRDAEHSVKQQVIDDKIHSLLALEAPQ